MQGSFNHAIALAGYQVRTIIPLQHLGILKQKTAPAPVCGFSIQSLQEPSDTAAASLSLWCLATTLGANMWSIILIAKDL